jgi:CDP-4-dehydro-6-deoxyglucose reductase
MQIQTLKARVDRITPLTDSILELVLAPEHYIDYQAGQYLQMITDKEVLSYSIANAPLGCRKYELHIRHQRHHASQQALFAEIKATGGVTISLPHGACHVNQLNPERPILFIAAGTGFAPIKAMIEYLLATSDPRSFFLYWSARSQSDLYMHEKVQQWAAHVEHFHYHFMVTDKEKKTKRINWILKHYPHNLADSQAVIAGPFDKVYAIRDDFMKHGLDEQWIFSDAFSFENKKTAL